MSCSYPLRVVFEYSAVLQQVSTRARDLSAWCGATTIEDTKPVSTWNTVLRVALDVSIGCAISHCLVFYSMEHLELLTLLEYYISDTHSREYIAWLMHHPAGLKMNEQLGQYIGETTLHLFDKWHTWRIYLNELTTIPIAKLVAYFGATFFMAFVCDILNLLTLHFRCALAVMSPVFSFVVTVVSALEKLFRGKKWNVLRKRVDTGSYDEHQIAVGMILFAVFLFLLPTVAAYAIFFTLPVLYVYGIQMLCLFLMTVLNAVNLATLLELLLFPGRLCSDVTISPIILSQPSDGLTPTGLTYTRLVRISSGLGPVISDITGAVISLSNQVFSRGALNSLLSAGWVKAAVV